MQSGVVFTNKYTVYSFYCAQENYIGHIECATSLAGDCENCVHYEVRFVECDLLNSLIDHSLVMSTSIRCPTISY